MELLPGIGAKKGWMAGTTDTFLRLGWTQTWFYRISLAVQGLRLLTPTAGGTGSFPGQGTKIPHREFSGGPGVKNLPANAGNMVSFPGLGRSHMLRAAKAVSHSYCAHTRQLLKPRGSRACALQQETTPQWEAWALQLESNPHSSPARESLHKAMQTQCSQK